AAQAIAGAEPRPQGSRRICWWGIVGRCSWTRLAIFCPVTTHVCSGVTNGSTRSSVSCIILFPLGSGRNCFGNVGVLSGQSRVPLPPARITAFKCFILLIVLLLTVYYATFF